MGVVPSLGSLLRAKSPLRLGFRSDVPHNSKAVLASARDLVGGQILGKARATSRPERLTMTYSAGPLTSPIDQKSVQSETSANWIVATQNAA